jgi:hypothetical protein
MKRFAFLSFTIATLIAPIQVQAQQTNCVRFPPNFTPEAEVQYLISHPGARVCPGPNPDLAGQARTLDNISRQRYNDTINLMNSMSGH